MCFWTYVKAHNLRRDKKDALRMVLGGAAAAQGDSAGALQHIKIVAAQHPHSSVVWNAYARAAACSGSMRNATRYLLGMTKKHPDSVPVRVLLGNSHMITVGTTHSSVHLFLHARAAGVQAGWDLQIPSQPCAGPTCMVGRRPCWDEHH